MQVTLATRLTIGQPPIFEVPPPKFAATAQTYVKAKLDLATAYGLVVKAVETGRSTRLADERAIRRLDRVIYASGHVKTWFEDRRKGRDRWSMMVVPHGSEVWAVFLGRHETLESGYVRPGQVQMIELSGRAICSWCDGTGRVHFPLLSERQIEPCGNCGGSGRAIYGQWQRDYDRFEALVAAVKTTPQLETVA